MSKQIILYNLAPHVTHEQYRDYVIGEKGPLLESLSSVKKFELIKIASTPQMKAPYQYVGIMHLTNLDDFNRMDAPSPKFQEFLKKWQTMVTDVQMFFGEEIY